MNCKMCQLSYTVLVSSNPTFSPQFLTFLSYICWTLWRDSSFWCLCWKELFVQSMFPWELSLAVKMIYEGWWRSEQDRNRELVWQHQIKIYISKYYLQCHPIMLPSRVLSEILKLSVFLQGSRVQTVEVLTVMKKTLTCMSGDCTVAFLFSLCRANEMWVIFLTHFSVTSWYMGESSVTERSEKFRLILLVIPLVMENLLWEAV